MIPVLLRQRELDGSHVRRVLEAMAERKRALFHAWHDVYTGRLVGSLIETGHIHIQIEISGA